VDRDQLRSTIPRTCHATNNTPPA